MKDHGYQLVLESIVADYPLTLEEASRLYQHLFIYSHGMASMVASGIYQFSMEEVIGFIDRSLSISHQRNGRKEMIQLENVHKSYGQTKVLKGIDF